MGDIWYYLGWVSEEETSVDNKTLTLRNELLKQIRNNRLKLRPLPIRHKKLQRNIAYYRLSEQGQ